MHCWGPVAPTPLNFKPSLLRSEGCSKLTKNKIINNAGYLLLAKPSLKLSGVDATGRETDGLKRCFVKTTLLRFWTSFINSAPHMFYSLSVSSFLCKCQVALSRRCVMVSFKITDYHRKPRVCRTLHPFYAFIFGFKQPGRNFLCSASTVKLLGERRLPTIVSRWSVRALPLEAVVTRSNTFPFGAVLTRKWATTFFARRVVCHTTTCEWETCLLAICSG